MPDSFQESSDGVVLVANGIDPVVRWDGVSAVASEAGVRPPDPAVVPVLAGSGSGGITGTYRAFLRFVDRFGNFSNLSTVSAEVVVAGVGQIDYSNLPIPQQATVVRRQILRNTDGQQSTFYVDVDDTAVFSATATGTSLDAQLAAGTAVPLLAGDGSPLANRFDPPPATKPFLAFHIGRMWYGGEQAYAEGSVQVAAGSATVTGIGTEWPESLAGRVLYVQGAERSYEIEAVDQAAQALTLTVAYEGDTDLFAQYAIKPQVADGATLYYSEAGLPEAVPPTNGFTLPEDGDVQTGLMQFGSFLYILKRRRMYRLTAQVDPADDGFVFYALGRGCVNHRCWVIVEETLYLLDEEGIYRTGGGDQAEQLSTPIQNLFRRDGAGINWAAGRFFHCSFDPQGETIRWHVALYGEYLPRHCITLAYKTGKFSIDDMPVPVGASCRGRTGRLAGGWGDEGEEVFLGGPAGEIYALGGSLDGVPTDGGTTRGRVTAAGADSITDGSAAFDAGTVNVPVCIVSGRGAGQRRRVVSATATTLRVDAAWAVKPDGTSVYQLGGIPFKFTSGRMRYAPGEANSGRSVEIQWEPTTAPQVFNLRLFHDFALKPRKIGREMGPGQKPAVKALPFGVEYVLEMTGDHGHFWQRFDAHRELSTEAPKLVRVQLEGVSGPDPVRFGEMVLNGLVR